MKHVCKVLVNYNNPEQNPHLLTISSCLKVLSRFCWAFLTSHRHYNREEEIQDQDIIPISDASALRSRRLTFLRSSRSSWRFLLSSTQMLSVMLSDSCSLWFAYSFSSFSTSWNACWLVNLRTHAFTVTHLLDLISSCILLGVASRNAGYQCLIESRFTHFVSWSSFMPRLEYFLHRFLQGDTHITG